MTKKRDFLYLLLATLAMVVLWVAFDIYHGFVTTRVSKELTNLTIPITPAIDMETIDRLKLRHKAII